MGAFGCIWIWLPVPPPNFAWQALNLVISPFISSGLIISPLGRYGIYGIRLALVAHLDWIELVVGNAAAFCVADVVLGDTHLHFL